MDPFGYHLINLVIHILNSILVYCLIFSSVKKLSPGRTARIAWPALTGALVFALHPIQTQAVSYIAQRAASLAGTFYLIGLLLYIRAQRGSTKICYGLAWISGAIAMLCKEISITFPLAIILWDLIFSDNNSRRRRLRWAIFLLLLCIIPLIILLNCDNPKFNDSGQLGDRDIFYEYEKTAGGVEAPNRITYGLTQIRVFITYLRLVVVPVNQNLDYDFPVFDNFFNPEIILSSFLIISLLTGATLLGRLQKPLAAFGIFFFFLALVPESSLVPIRDVIFEHRLYLPLLGVAFAVAQLDFSSRKLRRSLILIIILLGAMTFLRNRIWIDEITLWTDTAKKSPGKSRPHNNLGYLFNQNKQYDKALQVLEQAVEINPDYPEAMVNLAISYKNLNKSAQAEEICRRAIRIKPDYPEGLNTLGDILRLRGRVAEAEKEYLHAIELDPNLTAARNNLANLYRETGRPELAEEQYHRMSGDSESRPIYLNNIGLNLLEKGSVDNAIQLFKEAIALNPTIAQVHYNLGNAFFARGDPLSARLAFKDAITLDPRYSRAIFNLGIVESSLGNWDQARDAFLAVIELEPRNVQAHLKIGLIYFLFYDDPRAGTPLLRRVLELEPDLPEREKLEKLLKPLRRE